ncbi:MAG: DUF4174 domain-containing protein [Maritimibacter sp.]
MGKFLFNIRHLLATTAVIGSLSGGAVAQTVTPEPLVILEASSDTTLSAFHWVARPLVVFADSPFDPNFVQQMELIEAEAARLAERDVVVIVDTDPSLETLVREELRPRGFDLVLIGKDGQKYLRKPFPWDVREISRSIDKMPLRQQEMRDRR